MPRITASSLHKRPATMAPRMILRLAVACGLVAAGRAFFWHQPTDLPLAGTPAYMNFGPYGIVTSTGEVNSPLPAPDGLKLKMTITAPARTPSTPPASFPLVFFQSGFQLSSDFYTKYARAFASWGYVVVQYDLPDVVWPVKKVVPDDYELEVYPAIMDWIYNLTRTPSSPIYEALNVGPSGLPLLTGHHLQVLDTSRVAAAGHSRGGKMAALMLAAGTAGTSVGVLIDPVDCTSETCGKPGYPSAVYNLQAAGGRTAMLIGAGVNTWCNPVNQTYRKFYPVLLSGTWQQVVINAGHMQFTDSNKALNLAWDTFCGCVTSKISHSDTIRLAAAAGTAWLEKAFRPAESAPRVAEYLNWVQQGDGGAVTWKIKPASSDASATGATAGSSSSSPNTGTVTTATA